LTTGNRAGTLETLGVQVATLLAPLSRRLANGEILPVLAELGYQFPGPLAQDTGLKAAVEASASAGTRLIVAARRVVDASDADDLAALATAVVDLVTAVSALRDSVDALAAALSSAAALTGLPPAELAAFVGELPRRIVELTIVTALEDNLNVLAGVMDLFGVIERTEENVDSTDPLRPPFTRVRLRLDRLPKLLTSPGELAAELYGWGTPAFDGDALFGRVASLLSRAGFPAFYDRSVSPPVLELVVAEARVAPAVPEPGLSLRLRTGVEETFEDADEAGLRWSAVVRVRAPEDSELIVTPDGDLRLAAPAESSTEGELRLRVDFEPGDPADPAVVFGQQGGTRLQVHKARFEAGVTLAWDPGAGVSLGHAEIAAAIDRGELILTPPAGDGFLGRFLPAGGDGGGAEFALELGLRRSGLFIRGSAALELAIPVHRELGPLAVDEVFVSLRPDGERLAGVAAASLRIGLGPVQVVIDRVGLRLGASFPQDGGNLGPLQLDVGLEPPAGAGLRIDAGAVSGGGFLAYDETLGRYSGALALEAFDVAVSALGLLDTRAGTGGYSLLVVVAAEFSPIQLGLGFTLNGVGGLLGVNRQANVEALRTALFGPGLDDILFPDDPIGQAGRLLGDLATFFPPADGRYLFGPAAKIGWGTPPLVEADVAVLLELPQPVRLTLIGMVRAVLPSASAPLIVINLDVLGAIDFEENRLGFDAALRESKVLEFPLEGEAALRLSWGSPPNFALAIGGFNAHFRPPAGFPSLQRVKIAIGADDNPRIDIQGYLAVTSNTVQLGASAEVYAAKFGLNIQGWVGFDTLFTFHPFSFIGDISGGVRLRRGTTVLAGVHLDATLTGPRPWHAWGEACLEIWLLPDLCVPFNVQWGDDEPVDAPSREVWPLLEAAVEDPRNWSGGLPVGALPVCTLAAPPESGEGTLLDPVGTITLRQQVVPLNRTITKFGEATPVGPGRFDVTGVTLSGSGVSPTPVQDYFAAAQFEELTQDERISRDSFERMDSGLTVAGQSVLSGSSRGRVLDYETVIFDSAGGRRLADPYRPPLAAQLEALAVSAVADAPLRSAGSRRFAPPLGLAPHVVLDDERFVIAASEDLVARIDLAPAGSRGEAEQALARHLRAHPRDRGRLQVLPRHEAREAA
jgi:hypothetical protein